MSSQKLPLLQQWPTTLPRQTTIFGNMKSDWLPHLHLAKWREKSGLTQEQMGNKLGLTKGTISRWEAGLRNMDLGDLARVGELLNIEPLALFLSPDDFDQAVAIHRFARLTKEIGAARASSLLDGMGAPKYEGPLRSAT